MRIICDQNKITNLNWKFKLVVVHVTNVQSYIRLHVHYYIYERQVLEGKELKVPKELISEIQANDRKPWKSQ